VVIAPADHPRVGRRLRLSTLAQERWLMREAGSGTRMEAERHFAHAGFSPTIAMSLGSNEAVKHAVAAGLGIAVISRLAVQPELATAPGAARLAQLQVSGFPLRRKWSLVWRKDIAQTSAARRLIDDLQHQPRAAR
jgi:DNA-binding transcriptional LysR family regulator